MIKIVKSFLALILWIYTIFLTEKYIIDKLPDSAIVGILTLVIVIFVNVPIIFIFVNYIFRYVKNKNGEAPIIFCLLSFVIFMLLLKLSEVFIADKIPDVGIANMLVIFAIIFIYVPLSIIVVEQIFKIIKRE